MALSSRTAWLLEGTKVAGVHSLQHLWVGWGGGSGGGIKLPGVRVEHKPAGSLSKAVGNMTGETRLMSRFATHENRVGELRSSFVQMK